MRSTLLLLTLVLVGCSQGVTLNPDPIDVSGTVKLSGKSVPDGYLHFQPTGVGLPLVVPIANGNFKGALTPGQYTYYLTPGVDAATTPQKFREGSLDRQVAVAAGKPLDLVFE